MSKNFRKLKTKLIYIVPGRRDKGGWTKFEPKKTEKQ